MSLLFITALSKWFQCSLHIDLSKDESELRNVAPHFPDVCQDLDKLLRTVVDYPSVSQAVHRYNRKQFMEWKQSLGDSYSQIIANLRWHIDWQKDAKSYERVIEEWLLGLDWSSVI